LTFNEICDIIFIEKKIGEKIMFFKNTLDLLKKIQNLDIPVSNTTRGEAIQQTYRNNLTAKIRNTFFEDCKAYFENEAEDGMSIIPFITKEGIILPCGCSSIKIWK
jgi:hypothetical protein